MGTSAKARPGDVVSTRLSSRGKAWLDPCAGVGQYAPPVDRCNPGQVAGRFAGAAFDGAYRYLRVWVPVVNERWQVVAGCVTEIAD